MKLLRRLRYILTRGQREADLAEELDFHREMLHQSGGSRGALGNITIACEDARAVWIWPWLESIRQDIAYALRNLRRQPTFAGIAILTLAAGIGLNTSLFTVFNAAALGSPSVKDPSRIVRVLQNGRGLDIPTFRNLAALATTLAGLAAQRNLPIDTGEANPTPAAFVSGNYFHLLGVEMELGRGFLPEEDASDFPHSVVVLNNSYWLDRFHADPRIIDRQIQIEGRPYTIVGVTARTFTQPAHLWLPLSFAPRAACCAEVLARLAPGISATDAQAELNRLSTSPIELTRTAGLQDSKGRGIPLFGLMFVAVILVLLLTCANVANLLLARAHARRSEMFVRVSIGASHARIVRQLMTESLVLATAAAVLGLAAAFYLPTAVLHQFHQEAPFRLAPDGAVLAYTVVLTVLSCAGFGLVPALKAVRPSDDSTRIRTWLLAAEVAMSVVLLVGAGFLTKAVSQSRTIDPGFDIAGVSLASFEFPAGEYDANQFHTRLLDALNSASAIGSFGLAEREPLSNGFLARAAWQFGWIEVQSVSPGYFEILRIPIVHGRNLEPGDDTRRSILINETMARRYWNGRAIGQQFRVGDSFRQVVGIVRDTYSTAAGLERINPVIYQPIPLKRIAALGVRPVPKVFFHSAPSAVNAITAAATAIDPHVHVIIEPLSDTIDRWLEPARTGAALAGLLGAFALVIASVGMSGVFRYIVQQRTREIGIRMALGAQPIAVARLVLADTTRAIALGAAAGFLAAAPLSQFLQERLPHVSPFDPSTYLGVSAALMLATLCASVVPALRATRVDPMSSLRCQ